MGVFLIWYSWSQLTPKDIDSIKNSFKTANYWWVLASLGLGILSHISRAYRWHFLLEPLGYKPRLANSVMTVLIAYLLNLFIPRSGEFARAASIKKYEGIPFEKAFGTIVAERVTDVIMLLAIICLAFYIIPPISVTTGDRNLVCLFISLITSIFSSNELIAPTLCEPSSINSLASSLKLREVSELLFLRK